MEERLHALLRSGSGSAPRGRTTSSSTAGTSTRSTGSRRRVARCAACRASCGVSSARRAASRASLPPTVRHSVSAVSSASGARTCCRATARRWRPPRAAWRRCPSPSSRQLIDELADLAGEYFASIAALAGAAYKMEMNLARFYRRHLRRDARRQPPAAPRRVRAARRSGPARGRVARLVDAPSPTGARRRHGPPRTTAAWSRRGRRPRRRRSRPWPRRRGDCDAFRRLLAETQHLVPIREEQVARADDRLAGHAPGGAADRRGARRPRADRERGRRLLPDARRGARGACGGAPLPATVDVDARRRAARGAGPARAAVAGRRR